MADAVDAAALAHLAEEAWRLHAEASNRTTSVVRPSMPILYFGDVDRYHSSELRIITVGLNPSGEEFPTADPWLRFPEGSTLDVHGLDLEAYFRSLDRYFHRDRHPYMRWFGMAFGALLRGLDASYEPALPNTAIHTDLCSPVATDPTWSGLARRDQAALAGGYDLWHRLVQALRPHVILMSVAERHLDKVTLPMDGDWVPIHQITRARPYEFRARRVQTTVPCLLVWGRAAQLPFGSVSNLDKQAAGVAIKALIR